MDIRLSVSAKIYAALSTICLVLLLTTVLFIYKDEQKLAEEFVETHLASLAQNYFDSINTMMLTGTMASRQTVQQKLLQQPGIVEARIIRAPSVVTMYGKGFDGQQATNAFETKSLNGETGYQLIDGEQGRIMQYVMPIIASKDYRGTNCHGCHQSADGDVLGTVKLSYSLDQVDQRIQGSVFKAALFQLLIVVVGFGALALLIYRIVLFRLKRLRAKIDTVADNLDLTQAVKVHQHDELGAVVVAFNGMLAKFKESIQLVSEATSNLISSAKDVDDIADLSKKAVLEQKNATDSVAAAINQLDAAATEIEINSNQASNKSSEVGKNAEQGLALTNSAKQGINQLSEQVITNAEMITQLKDKTDGVGDILNIITGIAEQTNLLALNAAIEAARAGEQGRGFAVVADEVRSLAARTRESIEQIHQTITALQHDAQQAVNAMAEVRIQAESKAQDVEGVYGLFADITEQMRQLDEMNWQIAEAAKQQNAAAEEINNHVVNIKDVAALSSDDVIRGKQISVSLLALSEELQQQLKQFKY